jgi:hypothetical protein
MKNEERIRMRIILKRSKTKDGYPARTTIYMINDETVIERKYLIPASERLNFFPYIKLREFKDKVLIANCICFSKETMSDVIKHIGKYV